MTPGQVAYETYAAAAGGRSIVTGDVLPAWADQAPTIREAWEAAAEEVLRTDRVHRGEHGELITLPPGTPQPG